MPGLGSALPVYETGHEYVYKYNGKILTGIPDIDAHFSGVNIVCDILLQAVDTTTYTMMVSGEILRILTIIIAHITSS